jgi:hypothetical protein
MKRLSQYITERFNQVEIFEGGASGHMLHPFDVDDFDGYDIKDLISQMFGGKIEGMTEKMDGFGMQASMNKDGEVVFIRNKTDLNSEKGGMTIDEFQTKWKDNPTALKNYTTGGKIIEEVFKKVGVKFFNPDDETKITANCECIIEGTTNTIPYASDQVDFHNLWVYKWNGQEWLCKEVTKKGLDVLEKACEGIDKAKITPNVIIKYNDDSARLEKKWIDAWTKFLDKYGCAPNVTIEGIKTSLFFKYIESHYSWMTADMKAAMDLCRCWIFGEKKASWKDLKAIYQDHVDELTAIDKKSSKLSGDVLLPLQMFFYGLGADLIKITQGFINQGQDQTVKTLLGDLKVATEKIKKEGSLDDNAFLQKWLDVLHEIGEENLSSAEGIVFTYKGKMMKWTGGFVPLNRIIGYSKYTMKPKSLVESLFDDNVKKKSVPEKLAYVLKKFFGDDVALCEDHQGSTKWYEVNPSTMQVTPSASLNTRIINYFKKVDGLEIKQDVLPGFGTTKGYKIGDDDYWIYISMVKYGERKIKVSKEFYDSMALPHDQKGVVERGWKEWQRW